MNLSVYELGSEGFEHDNEVVHDFEVFADDLPIAAVTVHESDPTYAYYVGSDGLMTMLPNLREITADDVLRIIMEKLR